MVQGVKGIGDYLEGVRKLTLLGEMVERKLVHSLATCESP